MLEDFSSAEALVAETSLSPNQVRLAVAYRNAYPDDIDQAIADNRRPLEYIPVLYPFVAVADQ
jgi:hypothetical protein